MRTRLCAAALVAALLWSSAARAVPVLFPGNGNYYELISLQTSWANARTLAATYTHLGVGGHLATVTSAAEDSFIAVNFATGQPAAFAWIAGYEPNDDGVWLWGAGPENGVQFSQGGGATAPYFYVNWSGVEPNDYAAGEDFLALNLGATFAGVPPGAWIDSPNPNPSDPIFGFIVEYEAPTTGVRAARTAPFIVQHASPNPLAESGSIHLDLTRPAEVSVAVFDVAGRKVRSVATDVEVAAGRVSFGFDARALPSGIYFVRTSGVWRDASGGRLEAVGKLVIAR